VTAEHEAYNSGLAWGVGVEPRNDELAGGGDCSSWSNATCAMAVMRGIVRPAGVEGPHHAQIDRVGNLGYLGVRPPAVCIVMSYGGPHIGKARKPVADDARAREVGPSAIVGLVKADEQKRVHLCWRSNPTAELFACGAGGAKGGGQEECGPSKARAGRKGPQISVVTGAGAHNAASSKGKEEEKFTSLPPPTSALICSMRHSSNLKEEGRTRA